MTSFVLLAAGRSTRMHKDKALLDYQGNPWIKAQVQEIFSSQKINLAVIVDQIGKTEQYLPHLQEFPVKFIENSQPLSQPSDSLLLAVQMLPFQNGTFISPIDVPINSNVLKVLAEQIHHSDFLCIKPSFQDRGGHPVWLSAQALEMFRQKPRRLDEFIAELPSEKVQFVSVDSSWIHCNLNTPEEWESFVTRGRI